LIFCVQKQQFLLHKGVSNKTWKNNVALKRADLVMEAIWVTLKKRWSQGITGF
jgi:hypothetical protein